MSKTLQVQNGHIVMNAGTGILETVEGNRKAAQDLGEVQLQDYDPIQNYGSHILQLTNSPVPGANELIVRQAVSDAVSTLIAAQDNDPAITSDERIIGISDLQTIDDNQGGMAYLLKVDTESGGPVSNAVQLTSFNQLSETFNDSNLSGA